MNEKKLKFHVNATKFVFQKLQLRAPASGSQHQEEFRTKNGAKGNERLVRSQETADADEMKEFL